ncbi:alpha/beta hydrolase [Agromyces archimandritae]|uniref:Alpha/beta hydrolase n=1 Tax=Agromyces archimandritae TaxID=2781962 RepID=A0A975IPY1_9MICO|nr:alpha/beta hydrolase [Agromyces archimandritae]
MRTRVVFVHGIRTSATMWRGQLAALDRHGVDARAVDLPGHGARLGEEFTIDAAMDAVGAAVSAAHGDDRAPVLLVGLSLGGYLAMEYAGREPASIDGLVAAACGTLPRGGGLAAYRAAAGLVHRLPDHGLALNRRMAGLFLPPAAAVDIEAGGVALEVMSPALTAVGGLDPLASLARYPGPVWFVNGALDHFRADERTLLRAAADARLVIVPGATHLVSLTHPEAFTDTVLGAVAEVERRAALR